MNNRRSFIKKATSLAALGLMGPYTGDILFRNKPWRVALIGTGWYGKSDLFRLLQVANIEVVGLCDVDQHQLSSATELISDRINAKGSIKGYQNYQDLLREQAPDIVLIGTPDHWHALQAIDSIKAGAHVYLQKPISVDVLEGEAILATARKYNKVVQIGTQRRSTPHLIDAKREVIDNGLLGQISHVEMYCYYHMRANRNPEVIKIPDHFDYNLWTGPAPMRPFDGLPHRGWWRAFMQYSNGIMGDMCVHMLDTVRWMLDLGWPEQVYSTGGIYVQKESKSNTADTQTAVFTFGDLNCTWQHRSWGDPVDSDYPWGFTIYGENGTLKGSVRKFEFTPRDGKEPITGEALIETDRYPEDLTEQDIELHVASATRGQMIDFLQAIETGNLPVADVLQGHISTASCILANIAMEIKRPVSYDFDQKLIKNDEVATSLLARQYRKPYVHPYLISK